MTKNQLSLLIVGLAIAVWVVACQPVPVVIKETALLPPPPPTPIVCTQNPPGLALNVQLLSNRRIRVDGWGFEPGEHLTLVFSAKTETRSSSLESRPARGVNADGTFSIEETFEGGTTGSKTWNLAVVHTRGVACTVVQSP